MLGIGCIFIFVCEMMQINLLYRKVGLPFNAQLEEFIQRATIEDIVRYQYHSIFAWLSLTLGTICTSWK